MERYTKTTIVDTHCLHAILNKDHLLPRVLVLPVRLGISGEVLPVLFNLAEVETSTPADYTHAHMKYILYQSKRSLTNTILSLGCTGVYTWSW